MGSHASDPPSMKASLSIAIWKLPSSFTAVTFGRAGTEKYSPGRNAFQAGDEKVQHIKYVVNDRPGGICEIRSLQYAGAK